MGRRGDPLDKTRPVRRVRRQARESRTGAET